MTFPKEGLKVGIILYCFVLLQPLQARALSYIDPSGSLGLGTANIQDLAVRFIGLALGLLGIIAVMMVLLGGFQWLISGGNEDTVTRAKRTISSAIVGLIIILLAWAIVHFIIRTTANISGVV